MATPPYDAKKYVDIDDYIQSAPADRQPLLQQIRTIIAQAAPEAEGTISYNMPCFRQGQNLVYFRLYKKHLGFYPTNGVITAFAEKLSHYKTSKGAVQFPLDEALPAELIAGMVAYRVAEAQTTKRHTRSNK